MPQPTAAEAKVLDKNNNPQIADRQSAITAAEEAHSVAGGNNVSQIAVEDALDALGVAINELRLKVGQAHGLIDGSS